MRRLLVPDRIWGDGCLRSDAAPASRSASMIADAKPQQAESFQLVCLGAINGRGAQSRDRRTVVAALGERQRVPVGILEPGDPGPVGRSPDPGFVLLHGAHA